MKWRDVDGLALVSIHLVTYCEVLATTLHGSVVAWNTLTLALRSLSSLPASSAA